MCDIKVSFLSLMYILGRRLIRKSRNLRREKTTWPKGDYIFLLFSAENNPRLLCIYIQQI